MGGNKYPRLAVVHNVVHLCLLEPPADGGVVNAGALCCPANLEKARVVLEQDSDMVTALKPKRAKQLGTLVSSGFQLSKGDPVTCLGHDISRLIRMGGSYICWTHLFLPKIVRLFVLRQPLLAFVGIQGQTHRVHAVAQTRRRRTVWKYVAQMGITTGAKHLDAAHT